MNVMTSREWRKPKPVVREIRDIRIFRGADGVVTEIREKCRAPGISHTHWLIGERPDGTRLFEYFFPAENGIKVNIQPPIIGDYTVRDTCEAKPLPTLPAKQPKPVEPFKVGERVRYKNIPKIKGYVIAIRGSQLWVAEGQNFNQMNTYWADLWEHDDDSE